MRAAVAGAAIALDGEGSDWPAMSGVEAGPANPTLQGRQPAVGRHGRHHGSCRCLSARMCTLDGRETAGINWMCEKAIGDGV